MTSFRTPDAWESHPTLCSWRLCCQFCPANEDDRRTSGFHGHPHHTLTFSTLSTFLPLSLSFVKHIPSRNVVWLRWVKANKMENPAMTASAYIPDVLPCYVSSLERSDHARTRGSKADDVPTHLAVTTVIPF